MSILEKYPLQSADLGFCPICETSTLKLRVRRTRLDVMSCEICYLLIGTTSDSLASSREGSVATDPQHFKMLLDNGDVWQRIMSQMLSKRMNVFRSILGSQPINWLEIGPGSGGMEDIVKNEGGCWLGIEIDKKMAEQMKAKGMNVVNADFSQLNIDSYLPEDVKLAGGFDIVYFSQVFEHVTSPSMFLRNVYKYLRPGGIVYLDVPNNDGLTSFLRKINPAASGYAEIVPPNHMFAYGQQTLRYALNKTGFTELNVFARSYDDQHFGLVHALMDNRLKMKLTWFLSRIFGAGGNLVAIAKKPADL